MSGRHHADPASARRADIPKFLKSFCEDRTGATYTLVGLSLSVLIGMAGLGFDATIWYMTKRQLQTVSDVSALAGLEAMLNGAADKQVVLAALEHSERNGFVHEEDGRLIVNVPPQFGPYAGSGNHVEVIAVEDARRTFSSLFVENPFDISARSVAGIITVGGNCVLALSEDIDSAVQVGGNAVANINCGVASNSTSNSSLNIHGGGLLKASPVQVAGDIDYGKSESLVKANESDPPPATFAPAVADPYAGLYMPNVTAADCLQTDYTPADGETLVPGVYCGNLSFKNQTDLDPGVYVVYDGDLSFTSQADVYGDGVTFLFTGSTPATIGGLRNINGGATVNLKAPDKDGHVDGDYAGQYGGVLFYQSHQALTYSAAQVAFLGEETEPELLMNQINGSTDVQLLGALYFPQQEVRINGTSQIGDGCMEIVAFKVTFLGTTDIENDKAACDELGIDTTRQLRARLLE